MDAPDQIQNRIMSGFHLRDLYESSSCQSNARPPAADAP